MASPRLSPALNVVVAAAQKAGRRLLRDFGEAEKLQVSVKGPGDFVSQADMRAGLVRVLQVVGGRRGPDVRRCAVADQAAFDVSLGGVNSFLDATFLDVRDHGVKVSLVSPGLVAAGAGLLSPAGQDRPHELLSPDDVAAAVRFVVTFPATGCPVEIDLQPQRST